MGLAVVIGAAFQTSAALAQDKQQPPAGSDRAAPADNSGSSGQTAEPSTGNSDTLPAAGDNQASPPAAEPPQDGSTTAAPDAEPPAAPSQDSGATKNEAPANAGGSADVPPVQPEPPAAATEPAAPSPSPSDGAPATAVTASQLQIGAAVFGSDGAKIGEVNRVKSDDTGKVQEILVTDGVAAGINAKVFAISADKITSVSDGVKLSLSSEEAKKLPIIDNSNG